MSEPKDTVHSGAVSNNNYAIDFHMESIERITRPTSITAHAVDVRVIEKLPAYEKRKAILRPIRQTPDGHVGVIFNNLVYPLFFDCDGELSILITGATFDIKFTTLPKSFPVKAELKFLEEPSQKSVGSDIEWALSRNIFGVYIYVTAPDEIVEQIVLFLTDQMKLNVISWGETLDPNWANKFDWSIRLSAGLSIDTIKSALNKALKNEIVENQNSENQHTDNSINAEKILNELIETKENYETVIENIKNENVSLIEQKDAEIAILYEELTRQQNEFQSYRQHHQKTNEHSNYQTPTPPNKRGISDRTIANILYCCFPELAFPPDSIEQIKVRFEGSIAIWELLNRLNAGDQLRLEKINGVAGKAGWLELRKHINTGKDDRGRIYCRRSNKQHNFDVFIHWKKNDKEQVNLFKKLANYPPFETNETVFM